MFSKLIRGFSLSLMLALLLFQPILADMGTVVSAQAAQIEDGQTLYLTLTDLGLAADMILQGPYQTDSLSFSLPPDLSLSGPLQFDLQVQSDFQSLLQAFIDEGEGEATSNSLSGVLAIYLNGNAAGEFEIDQSGEFAFVLELSPDLVNDNAGENVLTFAWDASMACQYGVTTSIRIGADSRVTMPVENTTISLGLNDFPKPFYSPNNIQPYPVALVVPDEADEGDLSALMAVAAGLGKHSGGQLDYEIYLLGEVDPEALADYHLIFIGKQAGFEDFFVEEMPQINLKISQNADDGIVQLAGSGWNTGRAVLLVTGVNEQALRKASASIAAEDWLPYSDSNLAVITEVTDALSSTQFEIDQELGSLSGDKDLLLEEIGEETVELSFNIPGDTQISSEAYIELYFRHSQLIDYLQSSLTVSINGNKIGSVRFSDQSAENGLARILLPADSIQPLKNELEITYTIVPQDICADERSGNFWVSIYEDSYLHLPPVMEETALQTRTYLDDLPAALLNNHSLSSLVFTAENGDWQSWKYAAELVFNLGTMSGTDVFQPSARFTGAGFAQETSKSYILIGQTSDLPFSSGMNDILPLPFADDGSADLLPLGGIQFALDQTQPIGVLEVVKAPDSGALNYCIFGNSDAGLAAAFKMVKADLTEPVQETANVNLIEGEGNSHYFLVEPKVSAVEDEGEVQMKWYQRILGTNMERMNAILLLGSVLVTVIFVVWIFFAKPEKKARK